MAKYTTMEYHPRKAIPFTVEQITMTVIQVVMVIALIYLGFRVADLTSELDLIKHDQSGKNCVCKESENKSDLDSDQEVTASSTASVLIFDDDFNAFNITRWKHEITLGGGGNWEFEYYDNNRSNSYVKDGVLYIKPTFLADDIGESNLENGYDMDIWGSEPSNLCTGPQFYGCFRTSGAGGNYLNPIRSARIRTAESFNFKYGRVEVKAQLPKGDWIWPAIWMLPATNQYGTWPASGEIDIMESRGNAAGYSAGGVDMFGSTLHWGPFYGQDPYTLTHATKQAPNGQDFSQDFHIYGLIWNETYIGTYLDNCENTILSFPITKSFWELGGWSSSKLNNPWIDGGKNAPFDQNFFLIINVAVGGTNGYFPDGVGGKPWSDNDQHAVNSFWNARTQWQSTWNGEDTAMKIDSVKVWSM